MRNCNGSRDWQWYFELKSLTTCLKLIEKKILQSCRCSWIMRIEWVLAISLLWKTVISTRYQTCIIPVVNFNGVNIDLMSFVLEIKIKTNRHIQHWFMWFENKWNGNCKIRNLSFTCSGRTKFNVQCWPWKNDLLSCHSCDYQPLDLNCRKRMFL